MIFREKQNCFSLGEIRNSAEFLKFYIQFAAQLRHSSLVKPLTHQPQIRFSINHQYAFSR